MFDQLERQLLYKNLLTSSHILSVEQIPVMSHLYRGNVITYVKNQIKAGQYIGNNLNTHLQIMELISSLKSILKKAQKKLHQVIMK